ncbi:hypothetical protein ASPZODRAFT_451934 [Penicilliopsis zonata CBS 506.65]|uniref:Uncharacterized protein n=1 Tax=Penicilliopsis zonata CBS 506.65 TaxID=1073090 RepID=A0A1L9SWX0_9EURO|nr:hypothetical protein ASPZODRAFT_451934 [Penicilliopsis zonata CBS 506.65]OJJ51695.1 hypothetical protein ASPZODRAFT_451934 [Penicilliopsis zonata CBS 506.65]
MASLDDEHIISRMGLLALPACCVAICLYDVLFIYRRRKLHENYRFTTRHALIGLLGLCCSLFCAITILGEAFAGEVYEFPRLLVGGLWVAVSLCQLTYLTSRSIQLLSFLNSVLLSLTLLLTTNIPQQVYPLIWLDTPKHYLSTWTLIQLLAALTSSILVPLASPSHNYTENDLYPPHTSSPLTRWCLYTWISPLINEAYKRRGDISSDNLPLSTAKSSPENWLRKYTEACKDSPSLPKVLWSLFKRRLMVAAFFSASCGFFELVGTIGLYQLLLYLQGSPEAKFRPWFSITLFSVCPILRGLCMQIFEYIATHIIGHLKVTVISAVFDKLIHSVDSTGVDCGKLHNNISADVDRLGTLRYTVMTMFMVPVEITVGSILLFKIMGWYYIPSLVFLLVTRFPLSKFIASSQGKAQSNIMKSTDERMRKTNEAIRTLTTIKMIGCVQAFAGKILDTRGRELQAIWRKMQIIVGSEVLSTTFTLFALVLCLFLYSVIGGNTVNPDVVFTIVAVFNIIKSMLTLSVLGVGQYAQAMISLKRLSEFLNDSNQHTESYCKLTKADSSAVSSSNLSNNDQIRLVQNGLNVVSGSIGSGKSRLLQSLIFNTHSREYSITIQKTQFEPIGYASQTPWLHNGSIRDNILLGSPLVTERYKQVLHVCALEHDIASFQDGDFHNVGEAGRGVSGGQRQRIALARALFSPAKILALDDILSGLDPVTSNWIIRKAILGPLAQNRTIVLATNDVRCAQMANMVIKLEQGKVKGIIQGPEITERLEPEETDLEPPVPVASPCKSNSKPTGSPESEDLDKFAGGVSGFSCAYNYLRSFGNRTFLSITFIFMVGAQAMDIMLPWWLSVWSRTESGSNAEMSTNVYMGIFTGLGLAQVLVLAASLLLLYSGAWRASRDKHLQLLTTVLGATYSWIIHTPAGQIINRFSSDITSLDDTLIRTFRPVLETYSSIALRILTVSSLIPLFILPSIILTALAIYTGRRYRFASTATKHMYAGSLTPLYHGITETVSGLATIHAFRAERVLQTRFNGAVHHHVRTWEAVSDLQRWLAVRMDIFVALISFSVATLAMLQQNPSPAVVGLSLTLTTGLCTALLYLVYLSSLLEIELTSYHRIENYLEKLPQESCQSEHGNETVDDDWPAGGAIEVHHLSAGYSMHDECVIREMSFAANPGDRIAIVGRTGSGKTTLALSLLRMTARLGGAIRVDGVDIEDISVDTLRRHITFIPQEPVLFNGTIRTNLDMTGTVGDDRLQSALSDIAGDTRWKLDDVVEANGQNMSQGERQLIALARAMVGKAKILVIDEATANLDQASEDRLHAVLHDKFSDCTTVTITHRLHNILDHDQVLVLENGRVVEHGQPGHLLRQGKGPFHGMWAHKS